MPNMFVVIYLLLSFSLIINAYEIVDCLDTAGNNMGCQCASTQSGVSCPPNYYCPEYSPEDIQTYLPGLLTSNCQVTNTTVMCPCTPGFYCPANTSQPVYCCPGYYCPSDGGATMTPNDPNGLGTWGSLALECPENKFCVNGQVEPFDCPPLGKCPKGSDSADKKVRQPFVRDHTIITPPPYNCWCAAVSIQIIQQPRTNMAIGSHPCLHNTTR